MQKRAYEREIRHLDRLLADFVAKLTALGPPEELLLVITADHGEEFQEHGAITHTQLYDEVMHVPMFFRWPGVVPAGLEIETPVSLVDVVPTILDLTNTKGTAAVDGVSLVPLLSGGTLTRPRDLYFVRREGGNAYGGQSYEALIRGDWKLMRSDPYSPLELYNLKDDIGEQKNLASQMPEMAMRLHEQLVAWRKQVGARMPTPNDAKGKKAASGQKRKAARAAKE